MTRMIRVHQAWVTVVVLAAAATSRAQTGGTYDLTWNTIDGGGATSTGGSYSLTGTAGQHDAGANSGGTYTVLGGFWSVFAAVGVNITGANPPLDNPFIPGLQPFRDVLQTGTTPAVTQGIGAAGTPGQDTVAYAPISVTFGATPTPTPTPANVTIACTGGTCPTVTSVSGGPTTYSIGLSGPVPPGQCTTLTFVGTSPGQKLQYQYLPGDVNMNGNTSAVDVQALVSALSNGQAAQAANLPRYNINRVGNVTNTDVLRLIGLLNGLSTPQAWAGASVAACP